MSTQYERLCESYEKFRAESIAYRDRAAGAIACVLQALPKALEAPQGSVSYVTEDGRHSPVALASAHHADDGWWHGQLSLKLPSEQVVTFRVAALVGKDVVTFRVGDSHNEHVLQEVSATTVAPVVAEAIERGVEFFEGYFERHWANDEAPKPKRSIGFDVSHLNP